MSLDSNDCKRSKIRFSRTPSRCYAYMKVLSRRHLLPAAKFPCSDAEKVLNNHVLRLFVDSTCKNTINDDMWGYLNNVLDN